MSVIVLLVIVYIGLYVVLSVPSVQNRVKNRVCDETSKLLGGKTEIQNLTVYPFSEVMLTGVSLDSPDGKRCADIGKVAAGIDLWMLFSDRKIVLNYVEIIGLDVKIVQESEQSPLNIQFLIDALSPKEKNKPSALFDLRIRNIVVRNSKASFFRPWMADESGAKHKYADIELSKLRMDLSIPTLRNDFYRFDIRNIQFETTPGVTVRNLSANVSLIQTTASSKPDRLIVKDLGLSFPHSNLSFGDMNLNLNSIAEVTAKVTGRVTPSDFSAFLPELDIFDTSWTINAEAIIKNNGIRISEFRLDNEASNSLVNVCGLVKDFSRKDSLDIALEALNVDLSPGLISDAVALIPNFSEKGRRIVQSIGRVTVGLEGNVKAGDMVEAKGFVTTSVGSLDFNGSVNHLLSKRPRFVISAEADDVELDMLIGTDKVGKVSASLDADVTGIDRNVEGHLTLKSDECMVLGNMLTGIDLELNKSNEDIDLMFEAGTREMTLSLDSEVRMADAFTRIDAEIELAGFNPSDFGVKGQMADSDISATLSAHTVGDSADNLTGMISLKDLHIVNAQGKTLDLSELKVSIDTLNSKSQDKDADYLSNPSERAIQIKSDWLDADITGNIYPSSLAKEMKGMIGAVFPVLMSSSIGFNEEHTAKNDFRFDFNIKGASAPYTFFDTPVRPLTDIPIRGYVNSAEGKVALSVSTPYLQQGKNKLIRDMDLRLDMDAFLGMAKVNTGLIFPAKKGDAEIAAEIYAMSDKVNVNIGINPTLEGVVKGGLSLVATFSRIPDPFKPDGELAARIDILPSTVIVNDKSWLIADGGMDYSNKRVAIDNFLISHD
ncbi:MAG: hypothetical protein K2H22_00850, partial [Muribaculaceae bacterium]|nr:hypothetical protein [Muribaculaceae bacterium]